MDGGTAYPSFVHSLVGGDLCITDMRTHALHVLTLAGDFKRTIDASGALQFAMGVTSDGDSIFVADGLADCIHRLQLSTGALLATVGGLSYPHGLALAGGTLFCADWGNHRVQTFNSDTLEPLSAIGQMGEGAADLCYPRGVVRSFATQPSASGREPRRPALATGGRRGLALRGRHGEPSRAGLHAVQVLGRDAEAAPEKV